MSTDAPTPSPIVIEQLPHAVGEVRRHTREVRLEALLIGGGLFAPRVVPMELVGVTELQERVLAVDAQGHAREVELTYLRSARSDPRAAGSALLPDVAAGRRLVARAPEAGPLEVEARDGAGVSPELRARVARDARGLGRGPLFARFGPIGSALEPGLRLVLPEDAARAWFALSPGLEAGEAVALYEGVAAGEAVFAIEVHVHGALGADAHVDARLAGRVGVDPASAERVSAEVSGPVELSVEGHAFGFAQRLSGRGKLALRARTEQVGP